MASLDRCGGIAGDLDHDAPISAAVDRAEEVDEASVRPERPATVRAAGEDIDSSHVAPRQARAGMRDRKVGAQPVGASIGRGGGRHRLRSEVRLRIRAPDPESRPANNSPARNRGGSMVTVYKPGSRLRKRNTALTTGACCPPGCKCAVWFASPPKNAAAQRRRTGRRDRPAGRRRGGGNVRASGT